MSCVVLAHSGEDKSEWTIYEHPDQAHRRAESLRDEGFRYVQVYELGRKR